MDKGRSADWRYIVLRHLSLNEKCDSLTMKLQRKASFRSWIEITLLWVMGSDSLQCLLDSRKQSMLSNKKWRSTLTRPSSMKVNANQPTRKISVLIMPSASLKYSRLSTWKLRSTRCILTRTRNSKSWAKEMCSQKRHHFSKSYLTHSVASIQCILVMWRWDSMIGNSRKQQSG